MQKNARGRLAAGLFVLVVSCLLAPLGGIVVKAVANEIDGSPDGADALAIAADTESDKVGATTAEFRVDESGSATYSIPLYTVPGTAGVAPKLSLDYSSQGGYGSLGKGWSVSGLSSITRCRATHEAGDGAIADSTPRPINFTNNDRVCLDGQRLLSVSNSTTPCAAVSGMTAYQFRTEIETFQRVCEYIPTASPNNGPAFFTVERKDGSTSWYGDRDNNTSANRADGYFETTSALNPSAALSWAQTRFQDSTGNYIDYLYYENPAGAGMGEHLLKQVNFAGKTVLPGQAGTAKTPYASIVFNYSARPADQWAKTYASGGQLVQSRRLESITSCAVVTNCDTSKQARYYQLAYGASPSGNGLDTLTSVQECRDSGKAVCLPATTFTWSPGKYEFATIEKPANLDAGSVDNFEGFKLGDIDGDGRPDFVYIKDSQQGGTCGTEYLFVFFSTLDNAGVPTFPRSAGLCTPSELYYDTGPGEGSWQLFDYNGDGRDDLFVQTPSGWAIYPSLGRNGGGIPFNTGVNLIQGLSPAIPQMQWREDQPQLADINGDGLTDVVYPSGGALRARIMERQSSGGFAWGTERTISVRQSSLPPLPDECGGDWICTRTISGTPTTKAGFTQKVDYNGDSSSDLTINVSLRMEYMCPAFAAAPASNEVQAGEDDWVVLPYESAEPSAGDATPRSTPDCQVYNSVSNELRAFVVESVGTTIGVAAYGPLITIASTQYQHSRPAPPSSVGALDYGDINGDGLTDVFFRPNSVANDWTYRINSGTGYLAPVKVPMQDFLDQVRFADVNGDGRTDILHVVNVGAYKTYNARYALPGGGYPLTESSLPGGNARICESTACDAGQKAPMFADFDGDGNVDFLSLKYDDNPDLFVSRANATSRFVPRDTIVQVTNGLGSVTQIGYAPLTNKDVYRRGSMLYTLNYGRGSPIQDFLAPLYVVAKAASSAPQQGNPNAMATVYYRYASARIQGGGRGFLGYRQIDTFDPNHANAYVATTTTYSQNFPYTGMAEVTVKQLVKTAFQVPACLSGPMTESCFATPGQAFPAIAGAVFSNNVQEYEADTELLSGTYTAFTPGAQAPVHVRTKGTEEILSDPYVGGQTSKVGTTFTYGAYGNVSGTVVETYNGGAPGPMSTVTTVHSYTDSPANWILGRVVASTVTHQRGGRPDIIRRSGFSYDPTTGMLTQERAGAGAGALEESLKVYGLDPYGNQTSVAICANPATPAACAASAMQFHPADIMTVVRYSRAAYDSIGRYPISTTETFWNNGSGNGAVEKVTQTVNSRDLFGNVTEATDVNGVRARAQFGQLGRPYSTWKQTKPGDITNGASSLTTYRWCSQVACPTGAKFREQVLTTSAPSQWTYFDALGRPIMKAVETFNVGVANKDLAVTCTTYDATGKSLSSSTPFMVSGVTGGGPTVTAAMCSTGRLWSTTTYDALGRPTQVTAPEPFGGTSTVRTAYSGSQTIITDARNNKTTQHRTGNGELMMVTDANGLKTVFGYYADGSLYYVQRDAGRGVVSNGFVYDSMGRKIQQNDPDSGTTKFKYNALGELVQQIDPYGNRIENWYDGRGRVWKKVVWRKNPDGTETIETRADYGFDTATYGIGQLASETISGSYTDWRTQPALNVNFKRAHAYDGMGRLLSTTTTIDGTDYRQETNYDALGRPWKVLDASGRWAKTIFNQRGFVVSVCNSSATDTDAICPTDGNTYLTTLEADAWGHVVRERHGSSGAMDVSRKYYAENGRINEICSGGATCNLVKEGYGWDAAGNLSSQQKENRYLETYTYDSLNRLTSGSLTIQDGVTVDKLMQYFEYDALGNLCRRENAGWARRDYTYAGRAGCGLGDAMNSAFGAGSTDGTKSPHQVADLISGADHLLQSYDARGNTGMRTGTNSANNYTIKYSLEDQVYELSNSSGVVTRFWYGSDGARYKRVDGGKTTLYLGNVEIEVIGSAKTFKRTVAGIMLQTSTSPTGTAANYYLFHDHLGSLVRITNASGAVVNSMDFLAYGGRRDVNTQAAGGTAPALTTRGFTGHEMVDGLNIIHMNGRIYDNYVGRFLQPDPIVQDTSSAQGWNAYTYVLNNPLAYTDPTGMLGMKERQWLGAIIGIAGAVFTGGASMGWWAASLSATQLTMIGVGVAFVSGAVATQSLKGGLYAAFAAAATAGVASAFSEANLATQMFAQGVTGGVIESLQGGNFGSGFVAAGVTAGVMPQLGKHIDNMVTRMVVGAIIGGTLSEATGGKFANGAISGATQAAFSGSRRSVVAQESGAEMPGDPVIAKRLMRDANKALSEAGAYRAYTTEAEAAGVWAKIVAPIAGEYEVGALISYVPGEGYYIGGAYSLGSKGNVTGLIESGSYAVGTGGKGAPSAFIHTHPGGERFSGYDAAYWLGAENITPTDYMFDIVGDLTTAYQYKMNAYVATGGHLDYWNYSQYVLAQKAAQGAASPAHVGNSVFRLW